MTRRPPRYTRTATLCPYTTLCRSVALPLQAYDATFATLPEGVRQAVRSRWGAPEADPFFRDGAFRLPVHRFGHRSEEHTSELQSLMRISYAVFCLKKKNKK